MIRTANIKLSSREAEYLLIILRERLEAKYTEISSETIEGHKRRRLIDDLTFITALNVRLKDAAIDAFPHLDSSNVPNVPL